MKLKHFSFAKQKPGNDLFLLMPHRVYPVFSFLVFLIIMFSLACHDIQNNTKAESAKFEMDPVFKGINDSIRQFPKETDLLLRRAGRLAQIGNQEDADSDYKKAWDLQPGLETGIPYSSNLQILGHQEERLAVLKKLSADTSNNHQVQRLLADAYAANNLFDQALKTYDQMLVVDSLDAETWYEKGLLLEQLKDTADAIESLKKAYHNQSVDTYGLELAHIYAEQKNVKALQLCDYILAHDSAAILIDPVFIKGIYFSNTKQFPKAIEQFDICIHRDWKTTDAYLEKGMAYYHMKKFDLAVTTFKMAITVSNSDPDAYFWLGRSYESLGKKPDAILNYQKALLLDKTFVEARERIQSLDSGFAEPAR